MSEKISIMLIDDHPVVRDGLREMLERKEGFEVCAEADCQLSALEKLGNIVPDVAIVDISLKNGENGLDLVKALKQRYPHIRCLMLSMYDEEIYAERALRVGAWGYLMKSEPGVMITDAIKRIMKGEVFVSSKVQARMMRSMVGTNKNESEDFSPEKILSDRELQVFRMLGEGFAATEIAQALGITVSTIESYKASIRSKMNIESGKVLIRTAMNWVRDMAK